MNLLRTILLFLFTIPVFGSKFIIPIALLILTIPNFKYLSSSFYFYSLLFCVPIIFSKLFFSTEFDPTIFYVVVSILISVNKISISNKSLKTILFIFIFFHLLSVVSILQTGYDFIPDFIYGESRHYVQNNTLINFRPSGIFQEPSTFAIHYLIIAILLLREKTSENIKYVFLSILASLFTFSVISVLFILILIPFLKKAKYIFLIFIPLGFFIYEFLNQFALNKINNYFDIGIQNYSRFELLFKYLDNFYFAGFYENLSNYVAYDLGPIIFLFIYAGIFSFPIIIYISMRCIKDLNLLVLVFTKISVVSPLFWVVLNNKRT